MHIKTIKSSGRITEKTILKLIILFCIIFIVILLMLTNKLSNSPGSAQHTVRNYMFASLRKRTSDRIPNCGDRKNLTEVVFQYRKLVNKLASQPILDTSVDLLTLREYCLIPDSILVCIAKIV